MNYTWDFSPIWEYRAVIGDGLVTTLVLTLFSCSLGALLGLLVSLALVSKAKGVRVVTTVSVEAIRACPPLVLLIWAYYLLPVLTGFALSAMATTAIVFILVFAAFSADVYRGSIETIPRATLDSARSLGMSKKLLSRRVLIPELARRSFPALNALVVSTLKMSSLASVIAVHELTYSAQLILAQRPRPFEIYTATAAAYAVLVIPLVFFLRWAERQPRLSLNPVSHDIGTTAAKELLS
jgi:polar amino acid transport system permease protein